jgi:hypothetical protein
MKEINAEAYDAWKLENGYGEQKPCVFCKGDAFETVGGEYVCVDCLSEEPDEEPEYDGPPDSYWSHDSGPMPTREAHLATWKQKQELTS